MQVAHPIKHDNMIDIAKEDAFGFEWLTKF